MADLTKGLRALVGVMLLDACSLLAPSDAQLRGERDGADATAPGGDGGTAKDATGATDGPVAIDAATADGSAECASICDTLPPSCVNSPCSCASMQCGSLTCTESGGKTTFTCDLISCSVTTTNVTCNDGNTFCRCI